MWCSYSVLCTLIYFISIKSFNNTVSHVNVFHVTRCGLSRVVCVFPVALSSLTHTQVHSVVWYEAEPSSSLLFRSGCLSPYPDAFRLFVLLRHDTLMTVAMIPATTAPRIPDARSQPQICCAC